MEIVFDRLTNGDFVANSGGNDERVQVAGQVRQGQFVGFVCRFPQGIRKGHEGGER